MGMRIRVLIVEDVEPEAELMLHELQRGGYDPEHEIVDTAEAMAVALDDRPWDVIIADYVMPHFSGPEALGLVKSRSLDTPVIMVSGRIDEDILATAITAGARDCILKSRLARLVPAVRREIADALRRRRAQEARKQAEEALKTAYEEQEQRVAERTAELVEANILLGREISQRKQAEEESAAARAEAERREAEFRSFVTSMADGVALWDASGQMVFLNESGRQMLGMPPGTSLEALRYEVRAIDGEPIPEEQWGSRRALRGEEVKDLRIRVATRWKETIVGYSAAPVVDAQGRVIGATSVLRDITEQFELEQQREELYNHEHRIAQMLQGALVPPMVLVDIEGCRAALRYEPALLEAEVGGDFYDVFELSDGRVGLVIGDVAGKGLDAAVYVAAAKHAVRSYAYLSASPAEVMRHVNDSLCRTQLADQMETNMLTAFFTVVDPQTGVMTYANAGHEPPVIRYADGSIEELDQTNIALGVVCDREFTESIHSLGPDDTVVMVTDGITEARQFGALLFGKDGVLRYLSENPGVALSDIPSGLLEAARAYGGGRLQDDAAIVAFQCGVEESEG